MFKKILLTGHSYGAYCSALSTFYKHIDPTDLSGISCNRSKNRYKELLIHLFTTVIYYDAPLIYFNKPLKNYIKPMIHFVE